jgi:hypothetical protein
MASLFRYYFRSWSRKDPKRRPWWRRKSFLNFFYIIVLISSCNHDLKNDNKATQSSYEIFYKSLFKHDDIKLIIEKIDSLNIMVTYLEHTEKDKAFSYIYNENAKLAMYVNYDPCTRTPAYKAIFDRGKVFFETGSALFGFFNSSNVNQEGIAVEFYGAILEGYSSNIQIFIIENRNLESISDERPVTKYATQFRFDPNEYSSSQKFCAVLNKKLKNGKRKYFTSDTLFFSMQDLFDKQILFCDSKDRYW